MQGSPFTGPVMGRTTTHMEGNRDVHHAQDQDRQASQPGCRTRCKRNPPQQADAARHLRHQPPQHRMADWIDPEMENLTDDYVVFVQEHISLAREACGDPQVLIEQCLDFSHVVPGGFGTSACLIIPEPKLQIIDLKYGQGVLVEAEPNPQLMLYRWVRCAPSVTCMTLSRWR